jgi:2-haloacid dehalogenase
VSSVSGIAMVAFDMFGTLVHNESELWLVTFHRIVADQRLGVGAGELHREWSSREVNFRKTRTDLHHPESTRPFVTYEQAWRDAFKETFEAMGLEADAVAAARECVRDLSARDAFDGAASVLTRLAQRWPLGVISNADDGYLLPVIAHHGWSFDTVVSSEQAQVYKPAPGIFAAFCQEASVARERVLYVGDSPYDDVHGAALAGMRTVWLRRLDGTPGRTPPPEGEELREPDFGVDSLEELERLLLQQIRPA